MLLVRKSSQILLYPECVLLLIELCHLGETEVVCFASSQPVKAGKDEQDWHKDRPSQCIMLSRGVKIHQPQPFLPTPYLVD